MFGDTQSVAEHETVWQCSDSSILAKLDSFYTTPSHRTIKPLPYHTTVFLAFFSFRLLFLPRQFLNNLRRYVRLHVSN